MRTRVVATRKKPNPFQPPRVRGIENRHTIAEHVADINVPAVDHDLHAVRVAANIAVREVADTPANALRWNRDWLGRPYGLRKVRRRSQTKQSFYVFAAMHAGHYS